VEIKVKESQDICFIKDNYVDFLNENGFFDEEGEMVDDNGKVLKNIQVIIDSL